MPNYVQKHQLTWKIWVPRVKFANSSIISPLIFSIEFFQSMLNPLTIRVTLPAKRERRVGVIGTYIALSNDKKHCALQILS